MKRIVLTAVALLAASPAAAVTTTTVGANGGFASTPSYGTVTYFNQFNSSADTTRFTNAPSLSTTSVGGFNVAPLNDNTSYAFVSPSAGNTPTIFSTAGLSPFNQISLYWGSMDSFNELTFLGAGNVAVTPTYTGSQFAASNAESRYVTFTFDAATAAAITGIRFASVGTNAFEFDNLIIGTAAVPEASTWAMMVVGLGLVGGTMRRRAKTTVKTLAAA